MWSEGLALLLTGCAAVPKIVAETADSAQARQVPAISALTWACDAAEPSWSFEVEADAWTGGGTLWMAKDAGRVERHKIPSVSAEADGSGDRLSLTLSVVADWRYQTSGSSSAWRCADMDALSYQIAIYTSDGDSRADCRTWGDDPLLWDRLDDVGDCATVLETANTADTGA